MTKTLQGDRLLVNVTSEVEGCYIYYTTDGSDPTPESQVFVSPLLLPQSTQLRTLTYYQGKPREGIYNYNL